MKYCLAGISSKNHMQHYKMIVNDIYWKQDVGGLKFAKIRIKIIYDNIIMII